jgi:indolepyruvate ferredoxin oxidoreductase alpha subunit
MKNNKIKSLCQADAGRLEVLQGNIAFAVGCVRGGIHGADGYPGTPSTEVIDRGLSQVQDMINVGWSVNEAVALSVGLGHTLAGHDTVVTMKIPGLFQAGDVFTSAAFYHEARGALVLYVASDFTPSSTQHLVDPRYLFKSSFVPVFEPANHQDMLEAAAIAADVSRKYKTPVVILASGALCHSEGLVKLGEVRKRSPMDIPEDLTKFNTLPVTARANYDNVLKERMPALVEMVENSPLNRWTKGSGKTGVITYGANTAFVEEVKTVYGADIDILSLGFTHPLPKKLIKSFADAISGDVYVIEDGYRYLQEELTAMGLTVKGKEEFDNRSEWSPAAIAQTMGFDTPARSVSAAPVKRPPMICAGCPYRLYADVVSKLKKRGKIDTVFGDIGCNTLLSFFGAMDAWLAMGTSEGMRTGFSVARPEKAAKCISVLGDSTECHSGMDATRNAIFRNVPGVKVVLDNNWTAMTGGQPSPASPVNLAGEANKFDIEGEIKGAGADVITVSAYDRKAIQKGFREALGRADKGEFLTLVVRGTCIKKVPGANKVQRLTINTEKCDKCYTCLICPGIEKGEDGYPVFNNMCSGCGGGEEACKQMCPFGAMELKPEKTAAATAKVEFEAPPEFTVEKPDLATLPEKISLAIRGVGGQGNLFFGRVMTQLAFLAGYGEKNIVKGETHGMAQMGGPVLSTFSCGKAHSPVLMPGSADCLIAMEMSEVLRPGFLELLREGGSILMAKTRIIPQGMDPATYPIAEQISEATKGFNIIEVDVLGTALKNGDFSGRSANVVMMGALSKTPAFAAIPEALWLQAVKNVSPTPAIWAANYKAFTEGQTLI